MEKTAEARLEEVQTMHLNFNHKNFLFIAVNNMALGLGYKNIIETGLENILTKAHTPTRDKEGEIRSKRYANKLKNRVYDNVDNISDLFAPENNKDANQTTYYNVHRESIVMMLKKEKVQIIDLKIMKNYLLDERSEKLLQNKLKARDEYVFLINSSTQIKKINQLHAEEILCYVFDFLEELDFVEDKQKVHANIHGKKRPCVGCKSRMEYSGITQFNPRSGRFWLNTIKNQVLEVAKKTINNLEKPNSYVTFTQNKKENCEYDTCSDSDAEVKQCIFKGGSKASCKEQKKINIMR